MFRTDIFVGNQASKRVQLQKQEAFVKAVGIAVSETEINATPYSAETNEVFEEGARLWLAGIWDGAVYYGTQLTVRDTFGTCSEWRAQGSTSRRSTGSDNLMTR